LATYLNTNKLMMSTSKSVIAIVGILEAVVVDGRWVEVEVEVGLLPSSSSVASKSSRDGGRGGSVDSDSVGTIGHSVPSVPGIAQIGGRVTTVASIRIPSKAAIAKAAIA